MNQDDEINIKLELIREKDQNLSIITYFNKNSPNFYKQDDFYIWKPTYKEKNFIIEAFKLLLDNELKKTDKKLFKFSDKITDDKNFENNDNDESKFNKELSENKAGKVNNNSPIKDQIELFNQDEKFNDDSNRIINESINKNKIEKTDSSNYDQDKKIERILMNKKKLD